MGGLLAMLLFLGMVLICLFAFLDWRRGSALLHLPIFLVVMFPLFLLLTDEPGATRADLALLLPVIGLALLCYAIKVKREGPGRDKPPDAPPPQ